MSLPDARPAAGPQRRARRVHVRPEPSRRRHLPRPTIRRRLRYAFDSSLAHGPLALIGWLAVVVLGLILAAALVGHYVLGGVSGRGFLEDFWQSLVRVLDASAFEEETAWPSRLVALAVTLAGVLLAGSLIGLIATALDQRVEQLSKGRSAVLETDHTLILGWSDRLPVVVQELVVANENLHHPAIVILADRDIGEMDEEIRNRVGDTRNTRVVSRSGSPSKPADLELTNLTAARSVIVLAESAGDAEVVKAVLAVKVLDPDFANVNVVAEFATPQVAETIGSLTDGKVSTVNSEEVMAQITAQACHQSGLSQVYRELLDFDGDECYLVEVPELVGHTYAEALLAFGKSAVIGSCSADGMLMVNPAPDAVFRPGDRVIAVSEDDDTVVFDRFRRVGPPVPAAPTTKSHYPIRMLIVGWSSFGPRVIDELEEFLVPGSSIEICVDENLADPEGIRRAEPRLDVSVVSGGPEKLFALGERGPYDQVVVLGYRDRLDAAEADARTLLTLLTLRKLWPVDHTPRVRVMAQLIDQANVPLATVTGIDDFIVSDALASLMIAQLSEHAELGAVFDDLFDPEGTLLVLKPAHRLLPDAPVSFADMVAAGITKSASVLGYRLNATGEVVINPHKEAVVHLGPEDQVLLIGNRIV